MTYSQDFYLVVILILNTYLCLDTRVWSTPKYTKAVDSIHVGTFKDQK